MTKSSANSWLHLPSVFHRNLILHDVVRIVLGHCKENLTMADLPSTERARDSVLSPVSLLEHLYTAEDVQHSYTSTTNPRITEYQLTEKPASLKGFIDLFQKDHHRIIWITEHSFVRVVTAGSGRRIRLPGSYGYPRFRLEFQKTTSRQSRDTVALLLYAGSLQEAIPSLHFLVDLPDKYCYFDTMTFAYRPFCICPLRPEQLKTILSGSRNVVFSELIFTPLQCQAFVGAERIGFYGCEFFDGGARLVQQESVFSPTQFKISFHLPLDEEHLIQFWAHNNNQQQLESLSLCHMDLSATSCRALGAVPELELVGCELEDHGRALIEAIQSDKGPTSLVLSDTALRWSTFAKALQCNHTLKHLEVVRIRGVDNLRALVNALRWNQGLLHLCLEDLVDDPCQLFQALASHPSLKALHVSVRDQRRNDQDAKRLRTRAVAELLSVNQTLQEMEFDAATYHHADWLAHVAPRLECNRYQARFHAIRRMGVLRAALLGAAMGRVATKPSLLWMLLLQNQDVVASRLRGAAQVSSSPQTQNHT
jgi:hypothetical protein